MKYLKEGKWNEFKTNASHIFKKMNALKLNYENEMYAINQEFYEINSILYDEISECMIDLEDYLEHHVYFDEVNYPENYHDSDTEAILCKYYYNITDNKGMSKIYDMISKLNEYIGDDAYEVYVNILKNINLKYKRLDSESYPMRVDFEFFTIQY